MIATFPYLSIFANSPIFDNLAHQYAVDDVILGQIINSHFIESVFSELRARLSRPSASAARFCHTSSYMAFMAFARDTEWRRSTARPRKHMSYPLTR
jgi:hypothetical protein